MWKHKLYEAREALGRALEEIQRAESLLSCIKSSKSSLGELAFRVEEIGEETETVLNEIDLIGLQIIEREG